MRSPIKSSQIMIKPTSPAPCFVLISRDRYASCHVRVPDLEHPVAAIRIGERYFSFFKVVADSRRVLSIAVKLSYLGDSVALTKTAKGYAIWVWEPEIHPFQSIQAPTEQPAQLLKPASCKVLVSHKQYQKLNVLVPDLDQPLVAVGFEGKYYSIFRIEVDAGRILELVGKITQRGDETVITKDEKGFAICIWEPDAYPAEAAV